MMRTRNWAHVINRFETEHHPGHGVSLITPSAEQEVGASREDLNSNAMP